MAWIARNMSLVRTGFDSERTSVACFAASSSPPRDEKYSVAYASALARASFVAITVPLIAEIDRGFPGDTLRHHGPSFQPALELRRRPEPVSRFGAASLPRWMTSKSPPSTCDITREKTV